MISEQTVMSVLRNCYDPCCEDRQISVVDMGLIENVSVNGGDVQIDMVLTTGWCPFVANLNTTIGEEVEKLDGVNSVSIEVLWDPVWTMDRLSESARSKLTMSLALLEPYRQARLQAEKAEKLKGVPL